MGNDGADALAVAGCDLPAQPERDWVNLKRTYKLEKDSATHSIMDADLEVGSTSSSLCRVVAILTHQTQDFILSDEDLLRELENDD